MAAIERAALQEQTPLILLKFTVVHGFATDRSPDGSSLRPLRLLKRLLIGGVFIAAHLFRID